MSSRASDRRCLNDARTDVAHKAKPPTCGRRQLWVRCQEGAPSGFNVLLSSVCVCVCVCVCLCVCVRGSVWCDSLRTEQYGNTQGHPCISRTCQAGAT